MYLLILMFRFLCSIITDCSLFRTPGCPLPDDPDLRPGPPPGPGVGLAVGQGPAPAHMTGRYGMQLSFLCPFIALIEQRSGCTYFYPLEAAEFLSMAPV